MDVTFESLLRVVEQLPRPTSDEKREVQWCDDKQTLGLSRQDNGGIEIFICGDELQTSSPLIRRHMRFDTWSREQGGTFRANRLVLPSNEYYVPAAAFLTEELFRGSFGGTLLKGFAKAEPLIEMVLRRASLSEDELLGLIGELRLIDALLSVARDSLERGRVLDAWRGHERGTRDFVLGSIGIEVKSTRGESSRHAVSTVMQVDPRGVLHDGTHEQLYLLSLGFKPVDADASGMGFNLPELVESILQRLNSSASNAQRSDLQALFLHKVSQYGGSGGHGYEHDEMKTWAVYQGRWQQGFLRVYDMSDAAISVLRRSDVQRCSHVIFESVSFEIQLPDKVSGDINPQLDIFEFGRRVVGS